MTIGVSVGSDSNSRGHEEMGGDGIMAQERDNENEKNALRLVLQRR